MTNRWGNIFPPEIRNLRKLASIKIPRNNGDPILAGNTGVVATAPPSIARRLISNETAEILHFVLEQGDFNYSHEERVLIKRMILNEDGFHCLERDEQLRLVTLLHKNIRRLPPTQMFNKFGVTTPEYVRVMSDLNKVIESVKRGVRGETSGEEEDVVMRMCLSLRKRRKSSLPRRIRSSSKSQGKLMLEV